MNNIHRRGFLLGVGGMSLTAAAAQEPSSKLKTQSPEEAINITRALARYIVSAKPGDLSSGARKEGKRTLLNWMGCALGGCRHETVGIALAALTPFSGQGQATILGRKERLDVLHAAMINGIASHILDFDDTHPTIIHPAGPVASSILALSEHKKLTGADVLNALVLGVEAECRVGNAVYPAHYDVGWHITGTAGVFGAAAAAGKLLGLSEQQMLWAMGIAAAQPVGLQEMFGTMTKSFHPGRAAHNGLTAALLASHNFTSSDRGLEAKFGWANVLSTAHDYAKITEKLGETYEINVNTYKPFACGVVMHPTIDGCIQLRNEHKLTPKQIARVELRVHPLVMQLTSKQSPQTGLEGKFSIYHAAAVALTEGAGGVQQFSDRAVRDATVIGLRERVTTTVDPSVKEDQVRITVSTVDGARFEKYVEHAVGSLQQPMSDAALEAKFSGLADGVVPADRARRIMDLCWRIDQLEDASVLPRAASA